ncbi:type II and III secretion system protein family protein [Sphingomonas bacterium]|uniref:type II and III secretion system protein family protein n=1 Tax=Sphingomonas bacterium TaxID=1895847 RepID=UPI001577348E|nr:type II and III secretion system protein family protein [Sphingomonas bacterium]
MTRKLTLIGLPLVALPTLLAAAPQHSSARHPAIAHSAKRPTVHLASRPIGTVQPTTEVMLSTGQGELINLPADVSDVWVSNPAAADVYMSSPHQIHLLGKDFGEATLFATDAKGAVIYAANIRVAQNLTSIDRMIKLAMPDADIRVTTVGQIAVITGTVQSPAESAQAEQLITAVLNPGVKPGPDAQLKIGVINRLKTATPLQVMLQVRISEVSRSFVKNIGANLQNRAIGNGALLSIAQGRQGTISTTPGTPPAGYINGAPVDALGVPVPIAANGLLPGQTQLTQPAQNGSSALIGLAGHALGMDLLGSLDLGETIGQVSTLANPNLTALSGETATFLVGGEIPIPISQGLGAVSVEYKQYGISLAFTPTVLADGRISLRVRPEVSELSSAGAVQLNGTTIPALTTRRVETSAELGSGQSMMIGGLLQNSHNNSIQKTPGLGDVPVLGALFRSNGWQRNETELVIVITPYLVKPVNNQADIALPTDGEKAPTDLQRVFLGELGSGTTGGKRPVPTMAPMPAATQAIGAAAPVQPTPTPLAAASPEPRLPKKQGKGEAAATPGFSN